MILRWSKQLEGHKRVSNDETLHDKHDDNVEIVEKEVSVPPADLHGDDVAKDANVVPKNSKQTSPKPYTMPLPFPQRMAKVKFDLQFGKFLEVLQKLYISILFTDALSQMLSYANFLKQIFSNKRKPEEHETITLTEECSAVIQNNLSTMLKDPGSFSIPCLLGNVPIERALCDLGSSESLMALSLCEKRDLGEMKPTIISL